MHKEVLKQKLVTFAYEEGLLRLKGTPSKAGPDIEKYLSVFRPMLGQKDPKYLNPQLGYDWCCAYVYYLLQKAGYKISITPLHNTNLHLGAVKTWYFWALQEGIFLENTQQTEPGDLILFNHLIEPVQLDHMGIVIKNEVNKVITSEGNYFNTSGIFTRSKDNTISGYIRL